MLPLKGPSSSFIPFRNTGLMQASLETPAAEQPRQDGNAMEAALHAAAAASTSPSVTSMSGITPSRAVYPSPTPFSANLTRPSSFPPPLVYVDAPRGAVTALYILGSHLAGHPSVLHGGASAALVDEVMGRAAVERLPARKTAVTVTLEMTYRAPVRLDANGDWGVVAVCARVQSVAGRIAQVVGSVEDVGTGKKLVEARGTFVEPRELES